MGSYRQWQPDEKIVQGAAATRGQGFIDFDFALFMNKGWAPNAKTVLSKEDCHITEARSKFFYLSKTVYVPIKSLAS